jgi:hypothetical protein
MVAYSKYQNNGRKDLWIATRIPGVNGPHSVSNSSSQYHTHQWHLQSQAFDRLFCCYARCLNVEGSAIWYQACRCMQNHVLCLVYNQICFQWDFDVVPDRVATEAENLTRAMSCLIGWQVPITRPDVPEHGTRDARATTSFSASASSWRRRSTRLWASAVRRWAGGLVGGPGVLDSSTSRLCRRASRRSGRSLPRWHRGCLPFAR